ncbi:condensation domain-containing protein, partial [Paenibacillus elgii]
MKAKAYSIQKVIAANQQVKEKQFWQEQLSGEPALDGFPSSRLYLDSTERWRQALPFRLPKETADKLLRLANDSDVRLHVILLAAMFVLMYKYTGNEDAVIGSPIYTQGTEDAEFINTMLPLRVELDGG